MATDSRTYNTFAEPLTYTANVSGASVFSTTYTRDTLGRLTQQVETIGGVTTTFAYSYDTAGRLTQVQQNGTTTASYTYNANGNRVSGPGLGSPPTYDDQDRLTQYGPTAYTYTANGELATKTAGSSVTSYTYDELGNLIRVVLSSGTQIEYVVDGQNRRIGKKVNGTLVQSFLYDGALRLIAELDGNNAVVSRFVYATRVNVPDYMIKGGVTYRIVSDYLGSPRLAINRTLWSSTAGPPPAGSMRPPGPFTNTSSAGRVSTRTIDPQGRTTASQVTGLAAVTRTYDAFGRLATITTGAGPNVRTTTLAYEEGKSSLTI